MPIRVSDFEAAFLGGPAWRYIPDDRMTPAAVAAAARREAITLVTCRIPTTDRRAAGALEAAGFRQIEELLAFERPVLPVPDCRSSVEPASSADRDACIAIAVAALRQDRYHSDPRIGGAAADAIKAAWVANNLAGRADLSLVARDPTGRVVGFNQVLRCDNVVEIDLIAVAPEAQRQGYGRALVAAGLRAYAASAELMRVGTQASNGASVALYGVLGFVLARREATYHLVPA